jgi:hypothetical protein
MPNILDATYLIAAPPPQKHETGPSPAGRFLFAPGSTNDP